MSNILQKAEDFNGFSIQFYIETNDDAEIYRVKDNEGKIKRLKIYPFETLSQLRFCENNLLREVEILAKINHPSIIKLIENGEVIHKGKKYIYLITDFISGESLLDKLKREGILNPYNAISIAINLLETIDYLHNIDDPIIHNDISLENVILSYLNGENPILSNFSSAVYFSKSGRTFYSGLLNPYYMAPEQFNGITMPQSDLFSVGALIYHLCFGFPPWFNESSNKDELIHKLLNSRKSELSFFSNHIETFDNYFLDVIKKSLAIDINNRYKSAKEFISALKRESDVQLSSDSMKNEGLIKSHSKTAKNGFADIAGMRELKEILTNDVIKAISEKELYESYGISIPNGMLLYGPPGCGKTFISEKFAEEIGFNFLKLNPSDVKSKYINESEEIIDKIFKEASEHAPSVLFFDEIDSLVPNRDNNLHHMNASTVNEFLAQMSNCGDKGIFIIAATNRPDKIDPAILRTGRIDKKVYVSPPDKKAREEMFKLYLKSRPTDFSVNYLELANKTEYFVSSDIKFIIDESSRFALKSKSRISQEIILKIISDFVPSISKESLKYYEDMKNKLEDKPQQTTTRRPIGFKK